MYIECSCTGICLLKSRYCVKVSWQCLMTILATFRTQYIPVYPSISGVSRLPAPHSLRIFKSLGEMGKRGIVFPSLSESGFRFRVTPRLNTVSYWSFDFSDVLSKVCEWMLAGQMSTQHQPQRSLGSCFLAGDYPGFFHLSQICSKYCTYLRM